MRDSLKKALDDLQKSVDDLDEKGIKLSVSFGDEEIEFTPSEIPPITRTAGKRD